MYPNLTPWLLAFLGAASAAAVYISIRKPFLRKLALRQVSRRRGEATLVVAGSVLGTAIIVGSLIVGDTLNFSVKQYAYINLGPIDETVVSSSLIQGQEAARRMEPLRGDPRVDGLLTVRGDQAAVTNGSGAHLKAEPRATVWDVDFREAATFGGAVDGGSGLGGPTPAPGRTVLNQDLATELDAHPGDVLTFYLYGRPHPFAVARVVPTYGVAGAGTGAITRNAFFAPGTLAQAARAAGDIREPQTFTFVSNAGGVEGGNRYSDPVFTTIERLLGPLARTGSSVESPKKALLESAKKAGEGLGSLFLFIGSFSIIAGVLLLVNIFVMLAEERKPELGMLRAIGMKRSRLVRSFMIEGTIYALVAALIGVGVGIGVGRAVVLVAARIFRSSSGGSTFSMAFKFTPTSVVNGFGIGFLISFVTVTLTSMRISRVNIVAAIRDLSNEGSGRLKARWMILSTIGAALFAAAAASAVDRNQGVGAYVFPAITILALCPLLVRLAPKRWVYTSAALAVLAWTLLANVFRPHILDSGSSAVYVVQGVLLTFAAVFLVSEHQGLITRPLRPLISRPTEAGLAGRLAVAYPVARRFRTGAILIMYSLVVFTLVIIMILGRMIDATVDTAVADASGGFALRADFNPSDPVADPAAAFTSGPFTDRIEAVVPLLVARGRATMNARFQGVDAMVIGADSRIAEAGLYPLSDRLASAPSDRAAWETVFSNPSYVIVDQFLGQSGGGPPAVTFHAGETFMLTDPATGRAERKTIAGVLKSADGLRGIQNSGWTSPIVMSWDAARGQFSAGAKLASTLIKAAPGVSAGSLASDLQGRFLAHGLVVTEVRHEVERSMSATRGFFQLMQGFLALGLLIGVAGLGIVMVRAVRERRRTIGVLRALGFGARTVQRAFLGESSFVALEGIVLGVGLGVVTSYLLFANFPSFQNTGIGFPVPWAALALVAGVTAIASILATAWPARQASRIRPAVALRIAG